jgi:hypothetical protein
VGVSADEGADGDEAGAGDEGALVAAGAAGAADVVAVSRALNLVSTYAALSRTAGGLSR